MQTPRRVTVTPSKPITKRRPSRPMEQPERVALDNQRLLADMHHLLCYPGWTCGC